MICKVQTMNRFSVFRFVIALTAGYFVFYPLTDPDIFWHLASGREILSGKRLLFTDPFSFSPPGAPWIDLHWLYQISVYLAYKTGGYYNLLIFNSIIFIFSFTIMMNAVSNKKNKEILSWLLFCIFIFQLRYLLPVRPAMFTLLYMSIFIYMLERFSGSGKLKYLFLLLPVQVLWVNFQGLFMIGPGICFTYLAGEGIHYLLRRYKIEIFRYATALKGKDLLLLCSFSLIVIAVSALNPYFLKSYSLSFKLFGRILPDTANIYSTMIPENIPLLKMIGTSSVSYVYTFLGISVIVVIFSIINSEWLKISHVLLIIMFMVLSYMAQRNLILYAFSVIPFIVWNLDKSRFLNQNRSLFRISEVLLSIIVLIMVWKHSSYAFAGKDGVAPFTFPTESAEYLKKNKIEGNVFNADRYGGYLIWKLFPEEKVFIDTRLIIRSEEFFKDYLRVLQYPEHTFENLAQKYNITHVVVPVATTGLYLPLVRYLHSGNDWQMLFSDGAEVLFRKSNKKVSCKDEDKYEFNFENALESIKLRYGNNPFIYNSAVTYLDEFKLKIQ
jgi:hypothetical protein